MAFHAQTLGQMKQLRIYGMIRAFNTSLSDSVALISVLNN